MFCYRLLFYLLLLFICDQTLMCGMNESFVAVVVGCRLLVCVEEVDFVERSAVHQPQLCVLSQLHLWQPHRSEFWRSVFLLPLFLSPGLWLDSAHV
jgi:hypothetical protein